MDNIDENQIKLLSLGGNQRLKYFLLDYSLPQFTDPKFKYFIYALDYYRRLLKYEALSDKKDEMMPVKPDSNLGLESLNPIEEGEGLVEDNTNSKTNIDTTMNKTNPNDMTKNKDFELYDYNNFNSNNLNSKSSRSNGQTSQPRSNNSYIGFEEPTRSRHYDLEVEPEIIRHNQTYQPQSTRQNNNNHNKDKGFFGEMSEFFNEAGVEFTKLFNQMGDDIKTSKLDEKIKYAGKETKEAFEVFGKKTASFFGSVSV